MGEGRRLKRLATQARLHRHARARVREALGRGAEGQDRRVPAARRERRGARGHPLRGVRDRPRGVQAHDGHSSLRRPDDGRHRPPRGRHRRDEDGRRKDVRRDDAAVPELADRPERPPRHGQRLPREARPGVGQAGLRRARRPRRLHPEHDAVLRAHGGLLGGHHVRDERRVRLRLPPRQHGRHARGHRPARLRLRDRGRGRLDPHRRGADAAHHLRRAGDRGAGLLRLRARREDASTGQPSKQKSEGKGVDETERSGADFLYDEKFKTVSPSQAAIDKIERALGIENLYDARNMQYREPPEPGAEGAVALPPRPRLRDPGRRGEDRRRVHRPHHGRAAAGRRACTRRSRRRRASRSRRRTSRSRRSRSRTTSASTRSSPA